MVDIRVENSIILSDREVSDVMILVNCGTPLIYKCFRAVCNIARFSGKNTVGSFLTQGGGASRLTLGLHYSWPSANKS